MKRKESIIRYLGRVGRGDRYQIAEAIGAGLLLTSVRLTELKQAGIVKNVKWPDGSKVWMLTKEGDGRYGYYVQRDRERGA